MGFSIGVDASKALEGLGRIRKGGGKIRGPIVEALRVTAQDIRRTAAASIRRRSGGGEVYPRPGGGKYRASAPGAPPARYTGNLVASLRVRVNSRKMVARAIAGAPHAHLLEDGTKRMQPRPFMRPAEKRHEDKLVDRLRIGIERALDQL